MRAFVGIGSNVGNRYRWIQLALEKLSDLPNTQLVAMSKVYQTAPIEMAGPDYFLNAVAELEVQLSASQLLEALLAIEVFAGRLPPPRIVGQNRTLDLDLLLFGDQVIDHHRVTIPHPRMHLRWFVLKPLADLAATRRHPLLGQTIEQLLKVVTPAGK